MSAYYYTFKWEDYAEEAFVTGSFDDWQKSVRLEKQNGIFSKTVELPNTDDKIYYKGMVVRFTRDSVFHHQLLEYAVQCAADTLKLMGILIFVIDHRWTIDQASPHQADRAGNINNFLTQNDLTKASVGSAFINTVTPQETTVAMAGKKNKKKQQQQPQQTTATESKPADAAVAAAAAATASGGFSAHGDASKATTVPANVVPGGFPVTPANEERTVGINPLPAAPGAVNPIILAPGEKVPQGVLAQDVGQNVKLDKESYERSDALPGASTDLPPVSKNIIPEAGLPIRKVGDDPTINTVGAGATMKALAGQVPREPRVPEVVKESQAKAGAAPEASAVPGEVREKAVVEKELKDKIRETPAASEGTAGIGTEKSEHTGLVAGAAATTGGAIFAAGVAAKDALAERAGPAYNEVTTAATDAANNTLPESVKQQLPDVVQNYLAGQAKDDPRKKLSPQVPSEVKQSIAEAGESPEAAASTSAVEKEVESELLREVLRAPAVGNARDAEAKAAEKRAAEANASAAKLAKAQAPVAPTAATKTMEPKAAPSRAAAPAELCGDTKRAADKPAATPATGAEKITASKPEPAAQPSSAKTSAPNASSSANGSQSKGGAAATGPGHTPSSKGAPDRKKNRLSVMLSKIKGKLSDKK